METCIYSIVIYFLISTHRLLPAQVYARLYLCIQKLPSSPIQNSLHQLCACLHTYAHLAISLPKHFKHPHFCTSPSSSLVTPLVVPLLSHSTINAPGPSLTAATTAKANVNENLTHNHGECLLNIGAVSSLLCLSLLDPYSVLSPCELFLF
jgi:hypothetical protein